jgi:asparagine synthase (glutamine-hydrolysing)
LLAAYVEWGERCLERLVGMYSFVVFDTSAEELFLARDPFGIKPLFFVRAGDRFAFASEIGALLTLPFVVRDADPRALHEFLQFGLVDHRRTTMLAAIEQLLPGECARVSVDRPSDISIHEHWRPAPDRLDVSFDEAANTLRDLFVDSVRLHLRSDVPVGTALSGGIDSSAIVIAARRVGGADVDINSFSYIADDPRLDEERWVDLVADTVDAKCHKVRLTADDLVADLDHLIRAQGEPFAGTSIYAQHRVFRLAREHGVPVMLDGQGADELFAGYRSYLAARFASLVRHGHLLAAARLVYGVARLPDSPLNWYSALRAASQVMPARSRSLVDRLGGRTPATSVPWLDQSWFEERGVRMDAAQRAADRDRLRDAMLDAFRRTSLPSLLRYEDRNSMAFSVESRVPFLTRPLAEYVFGLPESFFVDSTGLSKAVFRQAMRGIVPDAVLDRRDKIGFSTPQRSWLERLAPWVDGVLTGEQALRVRPLRVDHVLASWRAALAGRRAFDAVVWRWLNVIRWAELFDVRF